ncbi:MAG: cysteine desulfurase [Saprospiraceae bacterium]|nr:cysteine desulfurase [Saprospiraceae bacterium]MBP6565890.1 cysteine desulfurase [Saprospiraceae bacterium]
MRIYLDNASTTPMLPEVIDYMTEVMHNDFGNPSSIHQHGRKAKSIIENARKVVAKVINASLGEVFFTSSATEANNMVIKNAVQDLGVQRIISSPTEHHCILHTLDYLTHHHKCEVIYLRVDAYGIIDYQQLEDLLSGTSLKTLVSIMHGNNEIGTMSDTIKIGQLCHKYGALYHCDAVQTIGKYHIDVQASYISFLSGSAHKFHGPKGVGFVFISNENIITPYIHGGAQERNMRAGTENVAGIAGLAKALEIICESTDSNKKKILSLRTLFKDKLLTEFQDITFNGSQEGDFLAHVLSVSFPPGPKADMLVMNLDIAGISASSGSACSAGIEEDSHVLVAIRHPAERKTIRFSFSPFNNEEEILYTVEKLKEMTPVI